MDGSAPFMKPLLWGLYIRLCWGLTGDGDVLGMVSPLPFPRAILTMNVWSVTSHEPQTYSLFMRFMIWVMGSVMAVLFGGQSYDEEKLVQLKLV